MRGFLSAALCALLCASAAADVLNGAQRRFLENRRICVRRDTTTIPGSVISYYERNGKPDTRAAAVVTNVLKAISGVEQNNPIQNELERTAGEARRLYVSYTNQLAQTAAYSNLYVIASAQAEAATAKIQDEVADLEAKIEKYKEYQTKYPLLKAVFAAMITDAENRIKVLQALTGGAPCA